MKKLKEVLDPKYTKICLYAGVTLVASLALVIVLYLTRGFWGRLWDIIIAVLRPLVIGGMFAYLLSPLVRRFERTISKNSERSWARPAAVALSYLVLFLIVMIPLALILLAVYRNIDAVSVNGIKDFFASFKNDIAGLIGELEEKLAGFGLSREKLKDIIGSAAGSLKRTGSGLLFGIIFSVYFLLDRANITQYWLRAYGLLTGGRNDAKIRRFLADADRVFSGYFRGQFVDMMIVGTLSSLALLIAGIPNAVMVGILTGIGNLIPYCGPIVGYASLILVCLPQEAWVKLIIGAVILGVVMFVDGNILNPKLLSSNIKVHPLLVIAALLAGGAIGGVVGMLVAVPAAALLKIQFDRDLDRREKQGACMTKETKKNG